MISVMQPRIMGVENEYDFHRTSWNKWTRADAAKMAIRVIFAALDGWYWYTLSEIGQVSKVHMMRSCGSGSDMVTANS